MMESHMKQKAKHEVETGLYGVARKLRTVGDY